MTLAGKARRPFHIFCAAVFSSGLLYPVPRAVVRFFLVTALRLPPALLCGRRVAVFPYWRLQPLPQAQAFHMRGVGKEVHRRQPRQPVAFA